jgi:cell division protein ZapE
MSLRSAYQSRIDAGEIHPDPGQAAGVVALARLESELNAAGEPSFLSMFKRPKALRGVYLWGPVGRGKSMLMDLFFAAAPVEKKQRVHFLAFMAEVHDLIHAWRDGDSAARKERFGSARGDDPIGPAADVIAARARLLAFDEFQVTDIADAMILGRLFEALFAAGVTVVATSNRPPDDLYKDGLNRQLFLPFIALLKARMDVVEVAGGRDWRLHRLSGSPVYFSPVTTQTRAAFEGLWTGLLDGAAETGAALEVMGRRLDFAHAAAGMLRVGFAELCGAALGPNDYLAVAERFHTVFLEDVPVLSAARRNEARRFVTLVDALYEARARLVVLAEAEPDALYPAGDGSFEFARTASRLHEMRSKAWLEGQES